MTRAPLHQIVQVRPEESGAIQLGTIGGKVTDANSQAAQIIRTYYLTDEIRSHMRRILTSIARGNAPSPKNLDYNAWLLDAGIGAFAANFGSYHRVKEFLSQRKDDIVLFAKQVAAEVPDDENEQWAEVQQAKSTCEAALDVDGVICDSGKWEVYNRAQNRLREAYTIAYTQAHAAYYHAAQTCINDLRDLCNSEELACLIQLESVPEVGGGAGTKARQEIDEALANTTICSRVLDTQLKTAVRCACGVALTDSFTSSVVEECLGMIEDGLQRVLAVLQSSDIKHHLLAAHSAEEQAGITDLLNLKPNDTGRLVELATPEMVEWIRQALSTLRSVEVTVGRLPVPPSFPYDEVDAIAETLKTHIRRLIEEAIDHAGYRRDVESGKSVVVRIKM